MVKRSLAVLIVLCVPTRAHAGASIFGFSMGEDSITLGAILTQAIQQVAVLNDVASFTKDMGQNIAFVKDVYATANDVINADWDALSSEFLQDVIQSDPSLREIYANTEAVMNNRVRRNHKFRRLLGAGFNQLLFESFGAYPEGPNADRYAVSDYQSMTLNALADQQMDEWKRKQSAKRIQKAWEACEQGLESCGNAQGKMAAQVAASVEDLKAIEAERARQEALRAATETAERKERDAAIERDIKAVIKAADDLKRQESPLVFKEEDFHAEDRQ